MRTREDIESYLLRSNLSYKDVGAAAGDEDAMWVVRESATGENIIVSMAGPMLLFRVKVLDLDHVREREPLFLRLLELNAQDMVHGAYGIADGAVVLTAGLPLENLDFNEFQVTVDDLTLALNDHYESIKAFVSDSTVA